jgi:hypothetical protein
VWINNGERYDPALQWADEPYDYSGYTFFTGDLKGNGLSAMIGVRPNPLRFVTWDNNGANFGGGAERHAEAYNYNGYLFFGADIDGDKLTDIVGIQPNPLRIVTWRNNSRPRLDGFDGGREWIAEPQDFSRFLFFPGDIDGDGRADILAVRTSPLEIVTWKNVGNSFDVGFAPHDEPYDYSDYSFFPGYIDGTKLTSLIGVRANPLRIVTWRNNGNGFDGGREWHAETYNYSGYVFSGGDVDRDGLTDVIAIYPNPVRIVTWKNNGSGFNGGREWYASQVSAPGGEVSAMFGPIGTAVEIVVEICVEEGETAGPQLDMVPSGPAIDQDDNPDDSADGPDDSDGPDPGSNRAKKSLVGQASSSGASELNRPLMSPEEKLRRAAVGAVAKMSLQDLRRLRIPLGAVLDALEE